MLAIGRGLMANPEFVMLDELAGAFAHHDRNDVRYHYQSAASNLTVLLIEQNVTGRYVYKGVLKMDRSCWGTGKNRSGRSYSLGISRIVTRR